MQRRHIRRPAGRSASLAARCSFGDLVATLSERRSSMPQRDPRGGRGHGRPSPTVEGPSVRSPTQRNPESDANSDTICHLKSANPCNTRVRQMGRGQAGSIDRAAESNLLSFNEGWRKCPVERPLLMSVCVCVRVRACAHMCACVSLCARVFAHARAYLCVHAWACTCAHVHMYV